jgi:hypothetical protein
MDSTKGYKYAENEVLEFVLEKREDGLRVSLETVCTKALIVTPSCMIL